MSVSVSRANGACVKKTCAKTGIYLIGETPACRTHVRQVLDEALCAAEVVAFDDLDSSHTPGQWSAAVKKEQDARAVMLSGENPCLEFDADLHIDWKGRFERLERRVVEEGFDVQELMSRMEPKGEGTKVVCICPAKPCAFCALPLKDRVSRFEIYEKDADFVRDTESGNCYLLKRDALSLSGGPDPDWVLEKLVTNYMDRDEVLEDLDEEKVKRLVMDKFFMPLIFRLDPLAAGERVELTWEEACWLRQIVVRALGWKIT